MTDTRAQDPAVACPDAADPGPDPDRMGLIALLGIAAGGAIGSGWLLGADSAAGVAVGWAWAPWLIGGVLMTVIALVMVELGRRAPLNGGLVFWPFHSSGPLVAVLVASALWIFYALNPATEAAAVVRAMSNHLFYDFEDGRPTGYGVLLSAGLMVPITAVNLLSFRLLRSSAVWLTAFKVLVPVTMVVLLVVDHFVEPTQVRHITQAAEYTHHSVGSNIARALTVGGVVYAYIGFQGPLDFAGQIKADGRLTEAARLKAAVLGTVVFTVVLYTVLQAVYLWDGTWSAPGRDSALTRFAMHLGIWGGTLTVLVAIDAAVSPAASGVLFVLLLGQEVRALSQAELTDQRLARARPLRGRPTTAYWPILALNLVIGWIELAVLGGDWKHMVAASGVLSLVVYSMPAVSLAGFAKHYRDIGSSRFRIGPFWHLLAWIAFVGVAEVLYWTGWSLMWRASLLLGTTTVILLGLPRLATRIERFRLYVADRGMWSRKADVQGLAVFAAFIVALLALSLLAERSHTQVLGSGLAALVGTAAFLGLRKTSADHMAGAPPELPEPMDGGEGP